MSDTKSVSATPDRATLAARLREQAQAHDDSVRAGDTGRIAEYHRESAVLSRQAADALAAMAWQPIASAPQNESVLVWCSHGQYVACLDERIHGQGIFGWSVDDNKHGPYALRGSSPTHWMPLPLPPTGPTEREG